MPRHPITFLSVLPYRAAISPGTCTSTEDGTTLDLSCQDALPFEPGSYVLDTHYRMVATLKTEKEFSGSRDAFVDWVSTRNPIDECSDWLLELLNSVLLKIRYALQNRSDSIPIRPIGKLDLIFYSFSVDGVVLFSRVHPSLSVPKPFTESIGLPQQIPNEWRLIVRAVDLVNHGFYTEGMLIAFALLDDITQRFVRSTMKGVTDKEADGFLRAIDRGRLATYLGPLLKLTTGHSPLEEESLRKGLTKLNQIRNDAMHSSESCSISDAKHALRLVAEFLTYFKEKGMQLDVPDKFNFW